MVSHIYSPPWLIDKNAQHALQSVEWGLMEKKSKLPYFAVIKSLSVGLVFVH